MKAYPRIYSPSDGLTVGDLRAYQAGQLTGAARHRVERILLDNPFYADALEGLEALQQAGQHLHVHTRDLHAALQERVSESATPRRLMPLWITSAAASIALVICVAVYHFFYVQTATRNVPRDGVEPGTVLIESKSLGLPNPATDDGTTNAPGTLHRSKATYPTPADSAAHPVKTGVARP